MNGTPLAVEIDRLRAALRWCYEKLQPLQPFDQWVESIAKSQALRDPMRDKS